MAEVEARQLLHGTRLDGSEAQHDCARETSPLTVPGRSTRRSRQKVLIVGDKRPLIYPRYRSSKTEKQRREHLYRGLPSAETAATRSEVSTGSVDSSEPATSGKSSNSISQTDGIMCHTYENECAGEMEPEWKLVEELLAL